MSELTQQHNPAKMAERYAELLMNEGDLDQPEPTERELAVLAKLNGHLLQSGLQGAMFDIGTTFGIDQPVTPPRHLTERTRPVIHDGLFASARLVQFDTFRSKRDQHYDSLAIGAMRALCLVFRDVVHADGAPIDSDRRLIIPPHAATYMNKTADSAI
ncbi:MAG: hypothetical protein ABIR91_04075 [Candidatus Saccharimonadales bacterium]